MNIRKRSAVTSGGMYAAYKNEIQPERNATNGKVGRMAREDIAITSITQGGGATYISAAVANFLADTNRGKVLFLGNSKDEYVTSILRSSIEHKYFPADVSDLYSICDCLVQDLGVYAAFDSAKNMSFSRATTKIVICHADSDSMRKLAEFAYDRADADRCYYLFNILPSEWEKNVYKAMDEYEAYCLPLFSAKSMEKEVRLVFQKIFGK